MKKVIESLEIDLQLRYIFLLAWVLMTAYYVFIVTYYNTIISRGGKLFLLNQVEQQLKLENNLLENKIASYSAIRYIDKRARQMGFKSPRKVEVID